MFAIPFIILYRLSLWLETYIIVNYGVYEVNTVNQNL